MWCSRLLFSAGFFSALAYAQCDPSPEVADVLERYYRASGAGRLPIVEAGLAAHPGDYFLLYRERQLGDKAQLHDRYRTAMAAHPDNPVWAVVYSDFLIDTDVAAALSLLERHENYPWARLRLVRIFESGKWGNAERMAEQIDRFLDACPATSDDYAANLVWRLGTAAQNARFAPKLRGVIEPRLGQRERDPWIALWNMEFKAHPPTEHAAVRERIGRDMARFAALKREPTLAWFDFLQTGYRLAGDNAGVERTKAAVMEHFPASDEAKRIVTEDWRAAHPYPKPDADENTRLTYHRAALAVAEDWHKRWPDDSMVLSQKFNALSLIPETTPERLASAADEYLASYWKNTMAWYGYMPMEYAVAEALIKKRIHLEGVPAMLDKGMSRESERESRGMTGERRSETALAGARAQRDAFRIERARILLLYWQALGKPEHAKEVDDEIASVHPAPGPKTIAIRKTLAAVHRDAARMQGKPVPPIVDEAEESKWEPVGKPLPAFELVDLGGRKWSLAELKGKRSLINIWTTWCGPCVAEHLEFQKLYEETKDRGDVVVLSFNVDYEPDLVAPYIKTKNYSFPVVMGGDILNAVNPEMIVPQNWLVKDGIVTERQIGYSSGANWKADMLDRLGKP